MEAKKQEAAAHVKKVTAHVEQLSREAEFKAKMLKEKMQKDTQQTIIRQKKIRRAQQKLLRDQINKET